MIFDKVELPTGEAWISGRYKCVEYSSWFAFFKPKEWKSWGDSCEVNNMGKSQTYISLEDAQAACKRHKERFGESPSMGDSIRVY